MTTSDPQPAAPRPIVNLLQIPDFLDPDTVNEIRDEVRRSSGGPASVLSQAPDGTVMPRIRKTTRVAIPAALRERVEHGLRERRAEIEAHFKITLGDFEEPQFLRYDPGDFFVAHQDGNTPLVYDASRFRRISVVVFLSTPTAEPAEEGYGGGALVFHGAAPGARLPLTPAPGTLVAFRSQTTHEVEMVTHGERYTIACFIRAPEA
jgi:SM-20-related protein